MANQLKDKDSNSRLFSNYRWTIFASILALILYQLGPMMTPFVAAAILAYICGPLVDKLTTLGCNRIRLGRTLATVIVLAGVLATMALILLILIPLLQQQLSLIAERLPVLLEYFRQHAEPWFKQNLNHEFVIDIGQVQQVVREHWQETSGLLSNIVSAAGTKGLALISLAANLLLLPVVLFYLLRDWDYLIEKTAELIPRGWLIKATTVAREIDQVLAEFLRGQLCVMFALCIFYSLGLWFAGLKTALSIGLLAGLLSVVPYLGFAIAFILAVLLALLQFATWSSLVPVLLIFGIGQVVESYLLTPYLIGDRIGLHPIVVIIALLAGGQLFGLTGVLLALPVSASIAVGLRHLRNSYLNSDTYLN